MNATPTRTDLEQALHEGMIERMRIISEQAATIEELQKALYVYGWHKAGCAWARNTDDLCTCGFTALAST